MMQKRNGSVSVESALKTVLASASELGSETIQLNESSGRILFKNIVADENIPQLDNSAMDGYAVRYNDTSGATVETPVRLSVSGEIQAGGAFQNISVGERSAVRIMTGAPIPTGADAVIPVEYTKEDESGYISVFRELTQYENIRFTGEDISTGQVVLRKGTRLLSADIGLLAALNMGMVPVYKRPRVAVISTGDEIAEVGKELRPGQIRNSNAYTLYAEVAKYNGIPNYLGIAKDSIKDTRRKLRMALEHDIVISTGGVSLGKYDLVKDVLIELGVDIKIETIHMKPGKPMIFGTKGGTILFGLPGNPVSTMVSFIEFVRPALLKMSGALRLYKPELYAVAENDIIKKPGRREFLRGLFSIREGTVHVRTTGPQGSGILRSMSEANCLIVIPEASEGCSAGDRVLIQLIHHEEIN